MLSIDQPFSREKVRDYFKTQIQKYRDHMSQLAALPVSDIKYVCGVLWIGHKASVCLVP